MTDDRTPLPGDCATVSVSVTVPPEIAFDVFTREIDMWWQKGPRFRIAGRRRGTLYFEPGLGGRLFESFDGTQGTAGAQTSTFEVGRVTAWEPPTCLAFEWRGVNFAPNESTLVTVLFEPTPSGTLVTVRHRGFAELRDDHPVRHGLEGAAFIREIGLWWGALMTALREHIAER